MRTRSTKIRIASLAVTLAVAIAAPAAAQQHMGAGEAQPAAVREFQEELGRFAVEYWEERLDGYKERIDRALLPDDLAALNRLRVRAMLFADRSPAAQTMPAADNAAFEFDDAAQGGMMEMLSLFSGTQAMAERYRPEMNLIGRDVVEDLLSFMEALGGRMERFAGEHPELAGGEGAVLGREWKKVREGTTSDDFLAIYSIAIEPGVLLYDRGNFAGVFNQAADAIGITLPGNSALRQNVPNPASSVTRIPYVLAEPSSATTLRLFDARGELQGTYDLGALPAGEHGFDLDVSSLPTGSYLYHLTVRTASGERAQSRGMQVVH